MTLVIDQGLTSGQSVSRPSLGHKVSLKTRLIALLLIPLIFPVLAMLVLITLPLHGRPFLYSSERMSSPTTSFRLLKIRTMRPPECSGIGPSPLGGAQSARVTPIGFILRRFRLDELPQIFNVLRGEIGFIGPRPPLRQHVDEYPEIYRSVLKSRPGITGLATVLVHKREERLLKRCQTETETKEVYARRCIPVKCRIDQVYEARKSFSLNVYILLRTLAGLV